MGSTRKTPFLGLNQWLGTDKPKRDDFNSDNLNVETRVKAHHEDMAAHITAQERAAWNRSSYALGTYTGNGATPLRTIELGYQPRVLFLYAVGRALVEYRSTFDSSNLYSAAYTANGATYGLEVTSTGFTVRNSSNAVAAGNTCALNQQGVVYAYIAFR